MPSLFTASDALRRTVPWLGACACLFAAALGVSRAEAHTPHAPWNENGRIGHQQHLAKLRAGKIDLYFLGDSITRRWGATDYPEFLAHWNANFRGWNAANFGWGGDTTHHVLWRLQNGQLEGIRPKVIVLLAGTNNIGGGDQPGRAADAAEGIEAIIRFCQEKVPETTILLTAIFPRNDIPYANGLIDEANARIARLADGKRVRFLDINRQLADEEGTLYPGMTVDRLHLSLQGYEVWARNLEPLLVELLGPRATTDEAPPPTGDPSASLAPPSTTLMSVSSSAAAPATEVVFDSFTYTGRDVLAAEPLPAGHFRNPILAGFFPDPSICRVGDDYYLVNSTFAYFPGLPIFHSRDLVNWSLIGHAIDRPAQLDYRGVGVSRGLFAPTIEHHDGVFYLVCTMIDGGGNFVLTATDPAGPWSDPAWLRFDGIDPSLFFDDDGRAWLIHNGGPPDGKALYDGHRAVWLREFDPVQKRVLGEPLLLVNGGVDISTKPVWIEGPHLYKREGWYYLTCAEGGTGANHSQVILRSRAVTGPFEPWSGNPILTQRGLDATVPGSVTCTGHADLEIGPDGRWWAVFLGCRPYSEGRYFTTGRETFLLPVTWTEDGWPTILPPGERVPAALAGPAAPHEKPAAYLNGNYTWTDNFSGPALDPLWIMLRAPGHPWWRIDTEAGKLHVTPLPATLAGREHPALLARRVQHARFSTRIQVASLPSEENVSAGLALFQAEKNHYFFAVRREGAGHVLVLELADRGAPREIARESLPAGWNGVALAVDVDDDRLEFSYAERTTDEKLRTFGDALSTRPVTVEAAGGGIHFTGAVVGLHVRSDVR